MDTHELLRLVAALVFTLALIGVCAVLARKFFGRFPAFNKGGQGAARLGVVEWRPLNGRHQLFLVRRDDTEHLLLVSPQGTPVVVESGICRREDAHSKVSGPLVPTSSAPLPLGPASRG